MKKSIRLIVTLGTTLIILFGLVGFRPLSARPDDARPLDARPLDARSQAAQPASELRLVARYDLAAYNLIYERYQQMFGDADVFGGQLTVLRDAAGEVYSSIGRTYAHIQPANQVRLSQAQAKGIAGRDIGQDGERLATLLIDPADGRYFYRVETRRADSRWMHYIDAGSGQLIRRFDALMSDCDAVNEPCGYGVAYDNGDLTDVKDLAGLTRWNGSTYLLQSADSRQETHDTGSTRRTQLRPIATDSDDAWVLPGNISPAQPALVDAQYYTNLTDDYYLSQHGFDWVAAAQANGVPAMVVHAHYSYKYVNAFWNGSYVAVGDGDQVDYRELTVMDVMAHEFSHAVTDFTSDLIYADESGALNEAFSDIMGASAEFYAEAVGKEPAVTLEPDWLVGEDLDLRVGDNPGFRNMADPEEDGDPDHYTELYTGSDDNGGVHTNSGVPNHAFYLAVEGGLNASCASPADHNSAHCTGSEQPVTGIGLAAAERIFFLGFTALTEDATMCAARAATLSVAEAEYGAASQPAVSVAAAWEAVGVSEALCGGGSTNLPPLAEFSFTTNALIASFSDLSSDPDGSLVSWSWNFGDGATSGEQSPSHTYAASGTYQVSLTVTDNAGATGSVAHEVTVTSGGTAEISLTVSGVISGNRCYALLAWSGATTTYVDVYRNGTKVVTTANDGAYTDSMRKVTGTYTYQVCEAGTSVCSNTASVTF